MVRMTTFCPAPAPLTAENLPDQSGKVFMITGATSGLGEELAKILYQRNGKVYIAARSEKKAKETASRIREAHPASHGDLIFIPLVLDDLSTIKASVDRFLAYESRLDVLWNNAGVMVPPQGSKSKQGYELQIGVNNLGHYLLTKLLRPTLIETAKKADENSVRVIWVSSSAADSAPKPAIDFGNMDYHEEEGIWSKYCRSKAGSVIHAAEFARQTAGSGIISLSLNPGNFVTNLQDNMPRIQLAMFKLIAHPPINGAYTELYAGLDKSITKADNGGWISPFGKKEPIREDLAEARLGKEYWDWSEDQVKMYS